VKYSTELYAEETEARTATERTVPCSSATVQPVTTLRSKTSYSRKEVNTDTASHSMGCGVQLRRLYYVVSLTIFVMLAIFILSGLSFLGSLGVMIVEVTVALLFLRLAYSGYLLLKMTGVFS
jgi:small-conductance mechanosensitive channel